MDYTDETAQGGGWYATKTEFYFVDANGKRTDYPTWAAWLKAMQAFDEKQKVETEHKERKGAKE